LAAGCAVAKNPANICGHNKVFAFKHRGLNLFAVVQ
jgi:hypothetical protein